MYDDSPLSVSHQIGLSSHLERSIMASNILQNPLRNPVEAASGAAGSMGADARPNKASFLQGMNDGPAETASKIAGINLGGKRGDVQML